MNARTHAQMHKRKHARPPARAHTPARPPARLHARAFAGQKLGLNEACYVQCTDGYGCQEPPRSVCTYVRARAHMHALCRPVLTASRESLGASYHAPHTFVHMPHTQM